jgi:GAF domain-containing protein
MNIDEKQTKSAHHTTLLEDETSKVLRCFQAVVAASEALVAQQDLPRGVELAVQLLREYTGLDRVYIFRDAAPALGVYLYAESRSQAVTSIRDAIGERILHDSDFPEVLTPLRAAQTYQATHPERVGNNAELNNATASRSDLMVPIMVEGRFWGIVGFDDCQSDRGWNVEEIEVLRGAASAIAAAVQRDLAVTQRETERKRYERLLRGVSEASQQLVVAADLHAGLAAAMQTLGQYAEQDRAYVFELINEDRDCFLLEEWNASGIQAIAEMVGTRLFPVADYLEVWEPLFRNQAYQSVTPLKTGANAALNIAVANRSDVMIPIFVGERCWGCVGFDNCHEERRYSDAEIEVLRGAAAAIAATIQRHLVITQRNAERLRYERLLRGVSKASQQLVGAEDLHAGLAAAMQTLGQYAEQDRAYVFELINNNQDSYLLEAWHAPGIPSIFDIIDSRVFPVADYHEVWEPQFRNQVYQSVTPLKTGANAALNIAVSTRSDVSIPIFVGERCWGCVGFDNCHEERHYSDAEIEVLRGAAAAIAAAVQRHQVVALRNAERIRYENLLQAVSEASQHFVRQSNLDQGLQMALAALRHRTGFDRVF